LVRFREGLRTFFLLHRIQAGCEVHLASYPMDTGGKAAEEWSWPLISICYRG